MVIGSFLLAAAQVAGVPVAAPALQPGETLLEVSEQGKARAVPDVARINAEVTGEGRTSAEALAAAAEAANRLARAAAGAGVASVDVRMEPISVRPRYRLDADGDETDQQIGFRAEAPFSMRNIRADAVPATLDALARAGARELTGPYFSFADDGSIRARARDAAIAAARREAQDYANAMGKRVGRVLRVSERMVAGRGGEDIVVTGARTGALLPIRPGEEIVTATVWIDYALVDR